jgi:hypothetical protein
MRAEFFHTWVIKSSAGGGMYTATFAIAFLAATGVAACARTVSTFASAAAVGFLDMLNVRRFVHCLSPLISRFNALSNGLTDVPMKHYSPIA